MVIYMIYDLKYAFTDQITLLNWPTVCHLITQHPLFLITYLFAMVVVEFPKLHEMQILYFCEVRLEKICCLHLHLHLFLHIPLSIVMNSVTDVSLHAQTLLCSWLHQRHYHTLKSNGRHLHLTLVISTFKLYVVLFSTIIYAYLPEIFQQIFIKIDWNTLMQWWNVPLMWTQHENIDLTMMQLGP